MTRTADANMRKTSDALASELDQLIQSASELLESLDEERGEAIDGLRSRAARNIGNARHRLAALKPQVLDGAAQAARATAGFARRNPWSAVAVGALIVGSVALLLQARRSHH